MKPQLQTLLRIARNARAKALLAAVLLHAGLAQAALPKVDLTQDAAGGKTLSDTAEKAGGILDSAASVGLALAAFIGFIITFMSAYTIYKAGKDEREKPTSAIIGIFVGGLLLAIPMIMWLTRNSLFGN